MSFSVHQGIATLSKVKKKLYLKDWVWQASRLPLSVYGTKNWTSQCTIYICTGLCLVRWRGDSATQRLVTAPLMAEVAAVSLTRHWGQREERWRAPMRVSTCKWHETVSYRHGTVFCVDTEWRGLDTANDKPAEQEHCACLECSSCHGRQRNIWFQVFFPDDEFCKELVLFALLGITKRGPVAPSEARCWGIEWVTLGGCNQLLPVG